MARVQVLENIMEDGKEGAWRLCFQWCRYLLEKNEIEYGYRFIWRRPDGTLQAARGQARIPSIARAQKLMQRAIDAGWGHHDGDKEGS